MDGINEKQEQKRCSSEISVQAQAVLGTQLMAVTQTWVENYLTKIIITVLNWKEKCIFFFRNVYVREILCISPSSGKKIRSIILKGKFWILFHFPYPVSKVVNYRKMRGVTLKYFNFFHWIISFTAGLSPISMRSVYCRVEHQHNSGTAFALIRNYSVFCSNELKYHSNFANAWYHPNF